MPEHPKSITTPPRVIAFPEHFKATMRLRDGRVIDAEFEGDPPPTAPLIGRRLTLIALEG